MLADKTIECIIPHEMMHANIIAFSKNGNRHIFDMSFEIKGIADLKKHIALLTANCTCVWKKSMPVDG
jgi:hypothetical protein